MEIMIDIPQEDIDIFVEAHTRYLTGVDDDEYIMNREISEYLDSQIDTAAQIKFAILNQLHIPPNNQESIMTLREALRRSGWEVFQNNQNERWNTTDLLNEILPGESPKWLDATCVISGDTIIDASGDELTEVR